MLWRGLKAGINAGCSGVVSAMQPAARAAVNAAKKELKEAVKAAGIDAEVEYITDFGVIAGYGVMSTPALAVNDKVVSTGRVLKPADIEKLLQ